MSSNNDQDDVIVNVGDYQFGPSIGEGGFAKVRIGLHLPTKTKVAVKVIKKMNYESNNSMVLFQREISAFTNCEHPFIAKFFDLMEDNENIYIIQELAIGGSLLSSVNSRGVLKESEIKHYFAQLICAFEYLHHHLHVMHRDIKAENVLLDGNNNIRLIDFGLCNILSDETQIMKTQCGSPAYAPPEMIQGKLYDQSAEVWSLGVLLYAISNCCLPFDDANQQRLLQKVVFTEPRYPDTMSPELIDLIKKMLTKNPKQRITLDQIKEHPFIKEHLVDDKVEQLREVMNNEIMVIESMEKLGFRREEVIKEKIINEKNENARKANKNKDECVLQTSAIMIAYKIIERKILTNAMNLIFNKDVHSERRGSIGSITSLKADIYSSKRKGTTLPPISAFMTSINRSPKAQSSSPAPTTGVAPIGCCGSGSCGNGNHDINTVVANSNAVLKTNELSKKANLLNIRMRSDLKKLPNTAKALTQKLC